LHDLPLLTELSPQVTASPDGRMLDASEPSRAVIGGLGGAPAPREYTMASYSTPRLTDSPVLLAR
jgi:hypothetical protein